MLSKQLSNRLAVKQRRNGSPGVVRERRVVGIDPQVTVDCGQHVFRFQRTIGEVFPASVRLSHRRRKRRAENMLCGHH